MKTIIKFILTAVASIATVLIAATKIGASHLPVTVSYMAVTILIALAALDYRVGSKSYLTR
jgi:hypothetical protein